MSKNLKDQKKERLSTKKSNIGWFAAEYFSGLLGTIKPCVATSTNLDLTGHWMIAAGLKKGPIRLFIRLSAVLFLTSQAQLLILGFKVDKKIQDEEETPLSNMKRKYFTFKPSLTRFAAC